MIINPFFFYFTVNSVLLMKNKLFCLFIFLFLLSSVFAVLPKGQMKIFAVTTEGTAVTADLFLTIESGSGEIWTNVYPLVGTTTQSAAITAVDVAENYSSETKNLDFKFDIDSDASIVEGPSAGSAMALLAISMLQDKRLNERIGITGTISSQGKIGPVGGVFAKTEEANNQGLKLFMIPKGESRQVIKEDGSVKTINLVNYAAENWEMKVVEVSSIDEVLNFAFSEIDEIDVNVSVVSEIKEFLPEPLLEEQDMKIMKQLAKKMLDESKIKVKGARNALSNTTLSDADVSFLLSTLNSAEQALIEGETLYEKNYLYSAANNVFIAKIYASLVKDVAENPSILNSDSKLFSLKVDDLKTNITVLKESLDAFIPLDYLEWHIAAKQRLLWAKINVEKIEDVSDIIIDVGARTQESSQMQKIEDYEFALAWFEASRELYDKTNGSKKKVAVDSSFKEYSNNYIIASEEAILSVSEEQKEDILRRLDSAKLAENYSWYLATSFDSASAYALIKASFESEDLSLEEGRALLESKINEIDANLSKKQTEEHKFIWARLYLDHAKYFLRSAEFYIEQGYASTASEKVKSGLALVFLSEELFAVSDSVYSYYDSFTEEDFIGAVKPTKLVEDNLIDSVLMASAIILFSLVLIVSAFLFIRKSKEDSLEGQLEEIRKLKMKSDNLFFSGKISEEKHNELNKEYSLQANDLRKKMGEIPMHLIHAEEFREEAKARERAIRDLKKLKDQKKISLRQYNEEYEKLLDEETKFEKNSKEELNRAKQDRKQAVKKTKSLKNKTKFASKKK